MMNGKDNSSTCARAEDLISVLYGEASEREKRDFEAHLKQCVGCQAEFAVFAQVRESIGEWREEALSGFVSTPALVPQRKSAIAAWRQFFDLSPLWMKGAVGFAVVVFCVLLAVALVRLSKPANIPQIAKENPTAVYTEDDMQRIVQAEVAKEQARHIAPPKSPILVNSEPAKNSTVAKTHVPQSRRPFSRAERDQLAADLRLLTTSEENDLELIDKE